MLGDAICSFNPTYGQGMTSAAMQAAELDAMLAERPANAAGIARPFFQRAAKVIDVPWQLAVGEDFRFPGTTGPKPAGVDLINRYVAAVHRATLVDAIVGAAFIQGDEPDGPAHQPDEPGPDAAGVAGQPAAGPAHGRAGKQ